jgi:glycosyltransferase involved in cell wall biosynthesis
LLPVLLFIGRLTPRKKLEELILAVSLLHRMGTKVNLLIIGDGIEKLKLTRLVNQNGLEKFVVFFGECYDEAELAPLIALSDLCVSPGDVGLTAIHSLSFGTPVITHNDPIEQMPEFEAIVPGYNGMLFNRGSVDSLADTIFEWINNNNIGRDQIRKRCYAVIDRHYTPYYQARIINSIIMGREIQDNQ